MRKPQEIDISNVLKNQSDLHISREVVKWFATDEGQNYLSEQIDNTYEQYKKFVSVEAVSDKVLKCIYKKRPLHMKAYLQWAAVLLPFLFLLGGLYFVNKQVHLFGKVASIHVEVPEGESRQVVFQDGTVIYMGGGSKLIYPERFALFQREISFSGEAYFDVASNKQWPFIINLSDTKIKVLGTSFNLSAVEFSDDVHVYLKRGKVCFQPYKSTQSYEMSADESITYHRSQKKLSKKKGKYNAYLDWKSNELVFENALLPQILSVLKRKYKVQFKLTDKKMNDLRYTINFTDKPLKDILTDLERITPIQIKQTENLYRIQWK